MARKLISSRAGSSPWIKRGMTYCPPSCIHSKAASDTAAPVKSTLFSRASILSRRRAP